MEIKEIYNGSKLDFNNQTQVCSVTADWLIYANKTISDVKILDTQDFYYFSSHELIVQILGSTYSFNSPLDNGINGYKIISYKNTNYKLNFSFN